jgi:hypothetical protein
MAEGFIGKLEDGVVDAGEESLVHWHTYERPAFERNSPKSGGKYKFGAVKMATGAG